MTYAAFVRFGAGFFVAAAVSPGFDLSSTVVSPLGLTAVVAAVVATAERIMRAAAGVEDAARPAWA